MKAATKNVNEGCSNCNESYDVSIMWNEWKAATKMKFKFESGRSKHSEICDGVSIRTKSSSTSKQSEICDGSINSSKISHGSRNWNEVCDVCSTWKMKTMFESCKWDFFVQWKYLLKWHNNDTKRNLQFLKKLIRNWRATTEMMCNANRDWKWNLWCKWKLKWSLQWK